MNKRIQELVIATDAWCDQNLTANWTDKVDEYLPIWNEKFAELIVRQCAYIARREDCDPSKCILTYFGVDE